MGCNAADWFENACINVRVRVRARESARQGRLLAFTWSVFIPSEQYGLHAGEYATLITGGLPTTNSPSAAAPYREKNPKLETCRFAAEIE